MQCLTLTYDLCNNRLNLPYFSLVANNVVHNHFTHRSNRIHIPNITTLDKRNFIYNSITQ